MRNRGGFDRRTGKTTSRNKGKTHWGKGKKAAQGRSAVTGKTGKAGAASPAKS